MSRTHGSGRRKGVGESIERACPAQAEREALREMVSGCKTRLWVDC
jgi:hypothetical protein